jgi:hypothetical protein
VSAPHAQTHGASGKRGCFKRHSTQFPYAACSDHCKFKRTSEVGFRRVFIYFRDPRDLFDFIVPEHYLIILGLVVPPEDLGINV